MTGHSIATVAATACRLLGVEPPGLCAASPLSAAPGQPPCARLLVYVPDAIGLGLLRAHPGLAETLAAAGGTGFELRSVVPAKTPVCLASMFTGAPPEVHGLRSYERPVLGCDTLFDALVRARRRVAVVAVRDSSMDIIFRSRAVDYFTEDYDPGVTARTLELVARDGHDVIVSYHQEYDDTLHRTTPTGPEALAAARRHVETFALLARATDEHWARHRRALAFCPDHGAHVDPATGRGTHGADIPEDMELRHCWRTAAGA